MLLDRQNQYHQDKAITSTTNGEIIDHGPHGDNMDPGLALAVTASESLAGTGTVQFILQASNNSSMSSPEVLMQSGPLGSADVTAGSIVFKGRVPATNKRYTRLRAEVTGTVTAGRIDAFLTPTLQDAKAYPNEQ